MKLKYLFLVFALTLPVSHGFSASKKLVPKTEIANNADTVFESANKELALGNFKRAATNFLSAYKLAVSIDDTDLLSRICLSSVTFRINAEDAKFDLSSYSETYLSASVEELLEKAKKFARLSDREKILSSVCKIYEIRLALVRGEGDFKSYISTLTGFEKELSKEVVYLAQVYRTKADVYMKEGNYSSARDYYQKTADLHTKNCNLNEIGMDWYDVARSCSLAGKKKDAISAIQQAIKYDRDAESTSGLGSDYYAYAKILLKGNPSSDEKKSAYEFADWSEQIYRAGDFTKEAENSRILKESIMNDR